MWSWLIAAWIITSAGAQAASSTDAGAAVDAGPTDAGAATTGGGQFVAEGGVAQFTSEAEFARALDRLSLEELLALPISVGSGQAKSARESPSSVWLLDHSLVRRTPATSLSELIRLLPGAIVVEEGPGQIESRFRFTGSYPENQVVVLMDGRPIQNDGIGIYDRLLFNVRDIEQVEVVFGPASTLYGANAFSGVVNIVTRRPVRQGYTLRGGIDLGVATGSRGREGDRLGVGPYAKGQAEGSFGWNSGGVKVSAGGLYEPSFGFETFWGGPAITAPCRSASLLLEIEQDLSARWLLRFQGTVALKSAPQSILESADVAQHDYAAGLRLTGKRLAGLDDELKVDLWIKRYGFALEYNIPAYGDGQMRLQSISTELKVQYTLPTFANNSLTAGAVARLTLNDGSYIEPWGRQWLAAGVYLEDTFRPLDALILTGGVRVDTRETPGDPAFKYASFSPRASVVWLFAARHSLRLEYASAFRTPTATERAGRVTTETGQALLVADRDIQGERVHAVQLGYMGQIGMVSSRVEAYVSRTINNLGPQLSTTGTPVPPGYEGRLSDVPGANIPSFKVPFIYRNLPGFWIPGATATVDFRPNQQLRTQLVYTFVPVGVRHTVGAVQYATVGNLELSLKLHFTDQRLADYNLFYDFRPARLRTDARAAYFFGARKAWSVGLSALNLLDVRFFHTRGPQSQLALYREDSFGELIGPRAWATIEYQTQ